MYLVHELIKNTEFHVFYVALFITDVFKLKLPVVVLELGLDNHQVCNQKMFVNIQLVEEDIHQVVDNTVLY